jgi:flagella basal body P-ring formation protein FlgA
VRRIPDVKKGEWVQIQLISGDVTLSTRGQAEEAGYLNQKLRVTSFGTKRLMEGELKSGGIVEVRL